MASIISGVINSVNSNNTLIHGSNLTSISTTNGSLISSNINYNSFVGSSTYNVLGEQVEIESSTRDPFLAQNLALINVLGKPFYEELIKNGFVFTEKIEKVLQRKFKILERDRKINSVLDDSGNENKAI